MLSFFICKKSKNMSEILVEVSRGTITECVHCGDIAVVDYSGYLLHSVGNAQKVSYMRSAAKPLQTLNVIISGAAAAFGFTPKELAVMSASHYAEPFHLETVEGVLQKIGLTKSHILGGTVTSLNPAYALQLAAEGAELSPLYSDCSGKHAGMLAVSQYKGYDLATYLRPEHPCQTEILQHLAAMCRYPQQQIAIGIDGCSAPVHALPLYNMALGFARLAASHTLSEPYQNAAFQVFEAMNQHPEMVAGTGGFCTDLIRHTHGKLTGKIGAEGVYCVGIRPLQLGVAIKIESGSMAMLPPVVMRLLDRLNVFTTSEKEALAAYIDPPNLNDVKTHVGQIRAVFNLP